MDYMQPQTAKKNKSPLQKPSSEYPSNKQTQWSESKKIQTFLTTAQPQRPETSKYEKNQQFFDTTPTKDAGSEKLSLTEMNQKI